MSSKNLELEVEEIKRVQKEILRRLDNQDRYLEQIYKDRELINENSEAVAGLKQRVVDLGNHLDWGAKFWEIGPARFYEYQFWQVSWPNQKICSRARWPHHTSMDLSATSC